MNCLFVCRHEPTENFGGIETVTGLLSNAFRHSGTVHPYCLYLNKVDAKLPHYTFEKSACFEELSNISALLNDWNIDVVVIQALNEKTSTLRSAINACGKKIPLIYVLHSSPGWEYRFTTWDEVKKFPAKKIPHAWVKVLGYPLYKWYITRRTIHEYQEIYNACDCFVVLSQSFIEESAKAFNLKDTGKFYSIPNPCRYLENDRDTAVAYEKKKVALVVSRLLEYPKRISRVIDVWQNIENNPKLKDWELYIVGSGPDEKYYSKQILKNQLKRVTMFGQCEPTTYYQQSQIFLMTSDYEGLPLTLIESQVFGCIPLAMNTFASLKDIITNDGDGIIIENTNLEDFSDKLQALMTYEHKRAELAKNAIKNASRYSCRSIATLWFELFNKLLNTEKG